MWVFVYIYIFFFPRRRTRQLRTVVTAFEGHLPLAEPDSNVTTSVTWLPAGKEDGKFTVTFCMIFNMLVTFIKDFTLSDSSHEFL